MRVRSFAVGLALSLALVGCGDAQGKAYTISAVEAAGVQPDADGPIIEDARQRLPAILEKCGIKPFDHIPASDSVIVLRFEVTASQDNKLECIRRTSPEGVEVSDTLVQAGA